MICIKMFVRKGYGFPCVSLSLEVYNCTYVVDMLVAFHILYGQVHPLDMTVVRVVYVVVFVFFVDCCLDVVMPFCHEA